MDILKKHEDFPQSKSQCSLEELIVFNLIEDFRLRRGFEEFWDDLNSDVITEILEEQVNIVKDILGKSQDKSQDMNEVWADVVKVYREAKNRESSKEILSFKEKWNYLHEDLLEKNKKLKANRFDRDDMINFADYRNHLIDSTENLLDKWLSRTSNL